MTTDLDTAIIQACAAMSDFFVLKPVALRLEQAWKAEKEPAERTPEVVLRAMLKAYEAAAVERWRAFYRACEQQYVSGRNTDVRSVHEAQRAGCRAESDAHVIRCALARWLELPGDRDGFDMGEGLFQRDWERRLSGARPIDAPPLEEP